MPDFRSYIDRLREGSRYYLGGVYRQMSDKDVFLWAQAIAFKVLITLVPIVILLTGLVGRILRQEDAFSRVARFIREYVPLAQRDQLIIFIEHIQEAGTFFTALGIGALLFSAMTLFTTLRVVIANVFQEEWHKERTILGGYLFDIRMAGQVGLLFILTFGFSIFTSWLNQGGLELVQRWGLDYEWVTTGWQGALQWVVWLIPYFLSMAMFFQLFFFVPKPHPPKRSALLGSVVTGLLWEAAKRSFAWYAANAGRFDRYRVPGTEGEESFQALGTAFGLIIAFVFWAYYSGIVMIVGGIIAVLHEKRHRMKRLREREARSETTTPETTAAEDAGSGEAGRANGHVGEAGGERDDAPEPKDEDQRDVPVN